MKHASSLKLSTFDEGKTMPIKPVELKSTENACISYHEAEKIILYTAKMLEKPETYKRIASEGKFSHIGEIAEAPPVAVSKPKHLRGNPKYQEFV